MSSDEYQSNPDRRSLPSATAASHAVSGPQFLAAIAIGFACSALVLVTAGSALNQKYFLDPFVYAAYIHDYPATLARFGRTYYSTRIAFIYPQIAFTHLFGVVGGYYVFRFFALAAAATAVFILGLRYYGYRAAILATTWLCFTPWLPRSILWTYVDGMAVVYLLLAITILLAPVRRRIATYAVAGGVFALAVNCNAIMLAVGGLLAPGFLTVYRRQGHVPLVVATLAVLAGFCLTYLVLALALYLEFPGQDFFFERVTFGLVGTMLGGLAATWFTPPLVIFSQIRYFALLIPVTLFLACLLLALGSTWKQKDTDRSDFALISIPYLASVIVLFLVLHVVFHVGVLSIPYYVSYLVPGSLLAFLFICGETERLVGQASGTTRPIVGAGLLFLLWLTPLLLTELAIFSTPYLWLALSVAVVALLRQPRIAPWAFITWAAVMPLSFYEFRSPSYGSFYSDIAARNPKAEWDVYRGAIFLQEFVNTHLQPNESVGFWYKSGDKATELDSVQSIFLWGYSRLAPFGQPNSGMPVVDQAFRSAVTTRRFIVLLGETADEIDAGLAALRAAGFSYRILQSTSFQGQVWGYKATLVALTPA